MRLPTTPRGAGAGVRPAVRRLARRLRSAALGATTARTRGWVPGEQVRADVAVHFADGAHRLYQLDQWLPVLERLHTERPVVLLLRRPDAHAQLAGRTSLRRVLLPSLDQLTTFYGEHPDLKVVLYVNNSAQNFQSLAFPSVRHVHVTHGESDKNSTVSNQAKAYDELFVAGEAARRRYRTGLLDLDESRLVPVGRPQLDLELPDPLGPSPRRTVLYAPTWEGESDANNYTSVDRYGVAIARAALSLPDVRLVYRPHPRLAGSADREVARAHREIVSLVDTAAREDPEAGHVVETDTDVLALLPRADLLVADVSSVTLDFLYLATPRPIVVTDRRCDRAGLLSAAPVAAAADVLDDTTLPALRTLLADRLVEDPMRAARERLRDLYFGPLAPGESTRRFLAAVGAAAERRDRLLAERAALRSGEAPPEAGR